MSDVEEYAGEDVEEHNKKVLATLKKGDIVVFDRTVLVLTVFKHVGIYSGVGTVIHKTTYPSSSLPASFSGNVEGRVQEEDFFKVAGKSKARKDNSKDATHKPRPAERIVANARAKIGNSKYNVLTDNCEHFANETRYGVKMSDQVDCLTGFIAFRVASGSTSTSSAENGIERNKKHQVDELHCYLENPYTEIRDPNQELQWSDGLDPTYYAMILAVNTNFGRQLLDSSLTNPREQHENSALVALLREPWKREMNFTSMMHKDGSHHSHKSGGQEQIDAIWTRPSSSILAHSSLESQRSIIKQDNQLASFFKDQKHLGVKLLGENSKAQSCPICGKSLRDGK